MHAGAHSACTDVYAHAHTRTCTHTRALMLMLAVCLEPCRTAYDNCTAILVTFKPPSVCQPHLDPSGAPPSRLHNPYHQNSPRHHIHRHQHQQQQFGRQYQELQEEQGARAHAEGGAAPRSHSSGEESPSLSPMVCVCVRAPLCARCMRQVSLTGESIGTLTSAPQLTRVRGGPINQDLRKCTNYRTQDKTLLNVG